MRNRLLILTGTLILGVISPLLLVAGLVYWVITGNFKISEWCAKIENWIIKNS